MIRKLIGLGIVVLVLAIVPETVAHFGFEHAIRATVAHNDPGAQHISASVSIPVLPTLITKSAISKVVVSARHVDLRTFTADQVTATASGVKVNLPSSLVDERADIAHIDRIHLALSFTAGEASRILPSGYTFVVGKDTVAVQHLSSSIPGSFQLEPSARIVFTTTGSSVPGLTRLPAISFTVPPQASCVRSVALTPGYLTVTCLETNPSTDLLPHR
ncbi:MAG: hypothetical protein ABR532_01245 [Candidatus Dormibacteria bacterium]